jgi:hypothetical protein
MNEGEHFINNLYNRLKKREEIKEPTTKNTD